MVERVQQLLLVAGVAEQHGLALDHLARGLLVDAARGRLEHRVALGRQERLRDRADLGVERHILEQRAVDRVAQHLELAVGGRALGRGVLLGGGGERELTALQLAERFAELHLAGVLEERSGGALEPHQVVDGALREDVAVAVRAGRDEELEQRVVALLLDGASVDDDHRLGAADAHLLGRADPRELAHDLLGRVEHQRAPRAAGVDRTEVGPAATQLVLQRAAGRLHALAGELDLLLQALLLLAQLLELRLRVRLGRGFLGVEDGGERERRRDGGAKGHGGDRVRREVCYRGSNGHAGQRARVAGAPGFAAGRVQRQGRPQAWKWSVAAVMTRSTATAAV